MSITDELRKVAAKTECANGRCEKLYRGDLEHIADRIDAEHERRMVERADRYSELRAKMNNCYIELPKDADGEYIHIGDKLDGYGKTIEVMELRYGRSGWVIISRDGNGYADTFAFTHHKPTAIADHIDAEHEQQMAERRRSCVFYDAERNYCKVHDEGDMAELGYVRLPVDADGEPIHIGDVMEWVPYDDTYQTVVRKVVAVGADVFFAWSDEKHGYAQYEACAYRHYYAQTVEGVLTEFGIDWEHESDCEDRAALLKEYATKLQLKEDE